MRLHLHVSHPRKADLGRIAYDDNYSQKGCKLFPERPLLNIMSGTYASVATSLSEMQLAHPGSYEGYSNNRGPEAYQGQGYNCSHYNTGPMGNHGGSGGNYNSFYIRAPIPPRVANNFHQVDRAVPHSTPRGPQVRTVPGNAFSDPGRILPRGTVPPSGFDHVYTVESTGHLAIPGNALSDFSNYSDFPMLPGPSTSAFGNPGQTCSLWEQHAGIFPQYNDLNVQSREIPALPTPRGGSFGLQDLHLLFSGNGQDSNQHEQSNDSNIAGIHTLGLTLGRLSGSSYFAEPYLPLKYRQLTMNVIGSRPVSFDGMIGHDLPRSNNFMGFPAPNVVYRPKVQQQPIGPPSSRSRTQSANTGMGNNDQHGASSSRTQSPLSSSSQTDDNKWGILGLLPIIKNKNNLNSIHQGVGIDLTTLGLDLSSSGEIYKTFASPWAEEPLKEEPTFSIPPCYNEHQPPPINYGLISKFSLPSLFYVFYSMPKDVAQLYAANSLATRGWMYHKALFLWLAKDPSVTSYVQAGNCERGSFFCFNPNSFAILRKDDFVLDYDLIEAVPALPPTPN